MANRPSATIYTDGACRGNPGPGGWAAIVTVGDTTLCIAGGNDDTTNNRMELCGAINALRILTKHSYRVEIHTDSRYLVNAFEKDWISAWKRNGWQRSDGPLKNKELWMELAELATKHECHWRWVKGHNGDEFNELADKLACKQRDMYGRGEIPQKAYVTTLDGKPYPCKVTFNNAEHEDPHIQVVPYVQPSIFPDDEDEMFHWSAVEDTGSMDGDLADAEEPASEEEAPAGGPFPDGNIDVDTLQCVMELLSVKETGVLRPCGQNAWCNMCQQCDSNNPCAYAFLDMRAAAL